MLFRSPQPEGGFALWAYEHKNGLVCLALLAVGLIYTAVHEKSADVVKRVVADLDKDTIILLFGLFIVIGGIKAAGVIDAIAGLFNSIAGDNPFMLYTLLVFFSVLMSAFVDNIPYVATMLPVVTSLSAMMGVEPYVFYFGLLTGATLGGNLTPIGASANITGIGILRKNGETVTLKDFLRIGVPFTLSAVLCGYAFLWIFWGV